MFFSTLRFNLITVENILISYLCILQIVIALLLMMIQLVFHILESSRLENSKNLVSENYRAWWNTEEEPTHFLIITYV